MPEVLVSLSVWISVCSPEVFVRVCVCVITLKTRITQRGRQPKEDSMYCDLIAVGAESQHQLVWGPFVALGEGPGDDGRRWNPTGRSVGARACTQGAGLVCTRTPERQIPYA